jgi:peptide/nickel transport system substrate-binding protein
MLKKRFFSLVLASILILSFVFSSVVVSADGGGTTIFLPVILKSSTLAVATQLNQIQNLNPFFRNTTSEEDIVNLTQLNLVTMDRQGMVVENAITGETRSFNGTPYTYTGPADGDIEINTTTGNTLYTFTLRPDLKFADGVPVSADDLIFTLYTFLDPSFDVVKEITTLPIVGVENYRNQTAPNITGIQKISETTITVEIEGFIAWWIYALNIPITPLHYYGSTAKYDYTGNMFGFDFGDLSLQHSKDNAPMGAGPYQFASNQNGVNFLGSNKYYYKGEPKINYIKFVEDTSHSLPGAIDSGSVDLAFTPYNAARIAEIYALNSNGELTGDVITTSKEENLGYGYIGINARLVKVGDDPASTASRDMRKAFSTILAVHRKPATEAYYGPDGATLLEYPIVLSSWASPQPGDPGYREAFSVDVDGIPIYVPGMTQSQRVAAAQQAALGFFEAAGFTISGGQVVAAPAGAKLTYEVIVPGGGVGDHPAYNLLTATRDTLAEIGITLTIYDPYDLGELWEVLANGTQELWTAAWGSSLDPDLFQKYHSSSTFDQPGSKSNHYYIQDQELDALIMQSRSSDDQALRKQLIQQAFDIIMDWGVEIPNYNRKNFNLFSTQRISASTITPDITPFWSWQNDIEDMSMK